MKPIPIFEKAITIKKTTNIAEALFERVKSMQ